MAKKTRAVKSTKPIEVVGSYEYITECGLCGNRQTIAYIDADERWEAVGHPDHINRPVCTKCAPIEKSRRTCCTAVYAAMSKKLSSDGMEDYLIREAIHTAWRTFQVDRDDGALVSLSRKLKVKSEWSKGR